MIFLNIVNCWGGNLYCGGGMYIEWYLVWWIIVESRIGDVGRKCWCVVEVEFYCGGFFNLMLIVLVL